MGIREKIKKLHKCHLRAMKRIDQICQRCDLHDDIGCLLTKAKGTDYYIYHFVTERALAKVLSILDEWELVEERTNEGPNTLTAVQPVLVYPGDTIIIYRRKKR